MSSAAQINEINANEKEETLSDRKLVQDRKSSFLSRGSRSKSVDDGEIRTISDIIGNWGPYQSRLFMFIAIYIIAPFQNHGVVFYTDKTDFWCKLPDGVDKVSNYELSSTSLYQTITT